MVQWESLTISWMDREAILRFVAMCQEDGLPGYDRPYFGNGVISNRIETPEEHGSCQFCR
jgi:hypothetical protein